MLSSQGMGFMTGSFEEAQDLLHDRFGNQVIVLPKVREEYIAGT